jgi:methionine synthase II (cobalamin-independent)
MRRSTERILTTHVGSLPRPDDLIRTMFAKQEDVAVDPVALEQRTRTAVAEVVAKQARAGEVWAKLAALTEGAAIASRELWHQPRAFDE